MICNGTELIESSKFFFNVRFEIRVGGCLLNPLKPKRTFQIFPSRLELLIALEIETFYYFYSAMSSHISVSDPLILIPCQCHLDLYLMHSILLTGPLLSSSYLTRDLYGVFNPLSGTIYNNIFLEFEK